MQWEAPMTDYVEEIMEIRAVKNAARVLLQVIYDGENLRIPLKRFMLEVLVSRGCSTLWDEAFAASGDIWMSLRRGTSCAENAVELLSNKLHMIVSSDKDGGVIRW
jgi:hypothetical protein